MTRRIVSLVPSLTETVCRMGLMDELVGCTSFCIDPPQLIKRCASVGGTKTPDIEAIKRLKPTHIITNDEENTPDHIQECEGIALTFRCLPKSPQDVPGLLKKMGEFLGCTSVGDNLSHEVEALLRSLNFSSPAKSRTFLYFIWRSPWMIAGPDTYISRTLELLGWKNAAPTSSTRYPVIDVDFMKASRADVVVLSSEPFPFRKRDVEALQKEWDTCPDVVHGDGKLLSWYGTHTLTCLQALAKPWPHDGIFEEIKP